MPEALDHLARRVFQPWRLRVKFVKAGERGVQVCLVEKFVAADSVAFDSEKVNHSPLGVEAFWRGPIRRMGDDRAEVC